MADPWEDPPDEGGEMEDFGNLDISIEASNFKSAIGRIVRNQKTLLEGSRVLRRRTDLLRQLVDSQCEIGVQSELKLKGEIVDVKTHVNEKITEIAEKNVELGRLIEIEKSEVDSMTKILAQLGMELKESQVLLQNNYSQANSKNREDANRDLILSQIQKTLRNNDKTQVCTREEMEEMKNNQQELATLQNELTENVNSKTKLMMLRITDALKNLQKAPNKKSNQDPYSQSNTHLLVSHALELLAKTTQQYYRNRLQHNVLLKWRQIQWTSARQIYGLKSFKRFVYRKFLRQPFQQIKHHQIYINIRLNHQKQITDNLNTLQLQFNQQHNIFKAQMEEMQQRQAEFERQMFDNEAIRNEKAEALQTETEELRLETRTVLAKLDEDVRKVSGDEEAAQRRIIEITSNSEGLSVILSNLQSKIHAFENDKATKADLEDLKYFVRLLKNDKAEASQGNAATAALTLQVAEIQAQSIQMQNKLEDLSKKSRKLEDGYMTAISKTKSSNQMIGTLIQFLEDIVARLSLQQDDETANCARVIARTGGGYATCGIVESRVPRQKGGQTSGCLKGPKRAAPKPAWPNSHHFIPAKISPPYSAPQGLSSDPSHMHSGRSEASGGFLPHSISSNSDQPEPAMAALSDWLDQARQVVQRNSPGSPREGRSARQR